MKLNNKYIEVNQPKPSSGHLQVLQVVLQRSSKWSSKGLQLLQVYRHQVVSFRSSVHLLLVHQPPGFQCSSSGPQCSLRSSSVLLSPPSGPPKAPPSGHHHQVHQVTTFRSSSGLPPSGPPVHHHQVLQVHLPSPPSAPPSGPPGAPPSGPPSAPPSGPPGAPPSGPPVLLLVTRPADQIHLLVVEVVYYHN